MLGMNCRDNMTLPQIGDLTAGPFVANGAEVAIYDMYRDRLDDQGAELADSWWATCRAATSRRS